MSRVTNVKRACDVEVTAHERTTKLFWRHLLFDLVILSVSIYAAFAIDVLWVTIALIAVDGTLLVAFAVILNDDRQKAKRRGD
jgi:hypothetical protein